MVLTSSLLSNYGLFGLFLVNFLSYSIIPLPSEAATVFSAIIFNPYITFVVAFVGATVGTLTNYYIGLKGIRKFMPEKKSKTRKRANEIFRKYGNVGILFFSWLPIIGDPLTIVAGSFKMNFWKFLVYTSVGKAVYIALTIILGHSIFSGVF